VEWIYLAQDRDLWWAVVNTVMNLWVPCKVGIYRLAESLLSSTELCSMELDT
jgi:hypothetical protein